MNDKIVVCDDDKAVLMLLEHVLGLLGFQVSTAADGEEAVALILRETPGLVLLDIELPRKNGFQVMEEIRRGSPRPSIVVLSSHESAQIRQRAKELGACDVWSKPFEVGELKGKVAWLMGVAA